MDTHLVAAEPITASRPQVFRCCTVCKNVYWRTKASYSNRLLEPIYQHLGICGWCRAKGLGRKPKPATPLLKAEAKRVRQEDFKKRKEIVTRLYQRAELELKAVRMTLASIPSTEGLGFNPNYARRLTLASERWVVTYLMKLRDQEGQE